MTWVSRSAVLGAAMLLPAACSSGGGGGDGDAAAFCAQNEAFDALEERPTDEQWDAWVASAPDEVSDDARALADGMQALEDDPSAAGEVFDDDLREAAEAVQLFRSENCPSDQGEGSIDTWCRITFEGVTEDNAEEYVAAAPAEVRDASQGFVDADPVEDPDGFEAAQEELLAYQAERCPEGQ